MFTLKFWSRSETFVRRSLINSSFDSCHGSDVTWQKSIVCVAQCLDALVQVRRTPSLLSDLYCFHASHDNHMTTWPASTILDRKSERSTRWIKEVDVLWTSMRAAIYRATYDWFLAMPLTTVSITGRRTKQASSDKGLWQRSKRQGKYR